MKATIEIEMNNAAFEENPGIELGRILRELAEDVGDTLDDTSVLSNGYEQHIHDINGNLVGSLVIE